MLSRSDGKIFIFHNIHIVILVLVSLYGSEAALRLFVPPWPMMGLHGTKALAGEQAWGRVIGIHKGMGFNSWGQRDLERAKVPSKGTKRAVFVGDSLLEESSTVPLSVATENKLGRINFELINLGVSATDPSEYYYRIKNIALALKPDRIFMFLYNGNDFMPNDSLSSYGGIIACYPKDSLFSRMGLLALNHLFTNNDRPVLRAWGKSGKLNADEQYMHKRFLKATDGEALQILLTMVSDQDRAKVLGYLEGRNFAEFFQGLRAPDFGLFRSYYLSLALGLLIGDQKPENPSDLGSYQWVKRAYDECKKNNVNFTVVIIPDAFEVDTRMINLWKPVVDMRALRGRVLREGARKIMALCRKDGMDCVDLYKSLKGKQGTYLNPDGHLSDKGIRISSETLAAHIERLIYKRSF
ncbi:MAG: hypothetical protein HQL21_03125 [Candidatus Omnitrophica bacterium]|nr:hypothetical protein [Candidatus Omnitrophota bacterium]